MVRKINQLVETVLKGLSGWPTLECVQRIPYHGAGLVDSPLFCLKLDVYFHESIPSQTERLAGLTEARLVETSLARNKDRFFLLGTPVHVEYRLVEQTKELVSSLAKSPLSLQQETTYGLFRLQHGIPVHTKSGWIRDVKTHLEELPEVFWRFQQQNLASRLEHLLSDLATAVFNRDPLFFQLSQASYLRAVCELLFVLNRQFLPPPEELLFQLGGLELLPPGFSGLFESLLRDDSGFDRERRLGLARHLAEVVLALGER